MNRLTESGDESPQSIYERPVPQVICLSGEVWLQNFHKPISMASLRTKLQITNILVLSLVF